MNIVIMMEMSIIIKPLYYIEIGCISILFKAFLQSRLQVSYFFRFFASVLRKTVPKPKKDRDV
jgi:hypothetical protein